MGRQKQKVSLRQLPLHYGGTSTIADDDMMKSGNNGSLSGDFVP